MANTFEILSSENQLTGRYRAVVSVDKKSRKVSLVHRTATGWPRLLLQLDNDSKARIAAIFSTTVEKLENSKGQMYVSVRLPASVVTDNLTGLERIVDGEMTAELDALASSMTVDVDIDGAVVRSWLVKNGPYAGERRYEVIGDLGGLRTCKRFSHLDFPPGSFTLEDTHGLVNQAAATSADAGVVSG